MNREDFIQTVSAAYDFTGKHVDQESLAKPVEKIIKVAIYTIGTLDHREQSGLSHNISEGRHHMLHPSCVIAKAALF